MNKSKEINMYRETFSALHASEHTLTKVMERVGQKKYKRKQFILRRAAACSIIIVLASSAVYAAGSRHFAGWSVMATGQEVRKRGFDYPDQLGQYCVDESSARCMHIAPPDSCDLRAWFLPNYVWMSLDYKKGQQSLSVDFGKTDNSLWSYCFDYDENTGIWQGAQNLEEYKYASMEYEDGAYHIENVTEHSYSGCTIYTYDDVREYFPNEEHPYFDKSLIDDMEDFPLTWTRDASARWVDYEAGICFSLHSKWYWEQSWNEENEKDIQVRDEQGMTQAELLEYVKEIIDLYR